MQRLQTIVARIYVLITLTKIVAVSFCVERWIWLLRKGGGYLNWLVDILLKFRSHFTDHHLSLPSVCMHPAHHFALKIDNNQCLLIINHYCPNNSALQYYNSRFSNNTVLGNTCVTIVSPKMWKFEVNISLLQFSPVSSWTALERGKNDRLFIMSQVTYARGSFQTWIYHDYGKAKKQKQPFPLYSEIESEKYILKLKKWENVRRFSAILLMSTMLLCNWKGVALWLQLHICINSVPPSFPQIVAPI